MPDVIRTLVWATSAACAAGTLHAWTNLRHLRRIDAEPAAATDERVSVLIPARDEERTIDECLQRIRRQRGVPQLEILVLDDNSGDRTDARVRAVAAIDRRILARRSTDEPPPGWLGKAWACHRLSREASGSVYAFVDADVRLEPQAIAAAVACLRDARLDLLSAWPRQVARRPLARLVQPLQQWSWLTTLPLARAEASSDPRLAAANGQFLVFDAAAYRAAGGHSAVRTDVLDDIALSRAMKRSGARAGLADASAVAACEMYQDDAALVAGYTKSLWRAFGGPVRGVLVTGLLSAVFVTPPVYALTGRRRGLRTVAGCGYLASVAGRVLAARATGGRAWPDSLAHPISLLALHSLTVASLVQRRRGATRWRGRRIP